MRVIEELLGLRSGDSGSIIVSTAISQIPVMGNLINAYEMNRLQRRVEEHEDTFEEIRRILNTKQDKEKLFYKQQVFPLILDRIKTELEDAKIPILLNGFTYCLKEDINDLDRIYHYYDVLSQLRISDIILLLEEFMPTSAYGVSKLNIKLRTRTLNNEEKEEKLMSEYQINKLLKLTLVEQKVRTRNRHRLEMSEFGHFFVEFFHHHQFDK
jgi:hypothetical protein